MELRLLIDIFKKQGHLCNKMVSVVGDGPCEIEDMEAAIASGFTSDNLVFGASDMEATNWEYAHISQLADGSYLVSSDMPHTGIEDILVTGESNAIAAISDILTTLLNSIKKNK